MTAAREGNVGRQARNITVAWHEAWRHGEERAKGSVAERSTETDMPRKDGGSKGERRIPGFLDGRAVLAGGGYHSYLLLCSGLLQAHAWSASSQASVFPLHVIPGSPPLTPALPDFSQASRQVCSGKFQASSRGDMLTSKFPKTRKKESGSGHLLKVTWCQAGGVKPSVTTAFPGSSASHGTHRVNYAETIRFPPSDSC